MLVARLTIVVALILAANGWAVLAAPSALARVSGEAYGVAVGAPPAPIAGSPRVTLPPEGGSLADSAPGVGIGTGGIIGTADQVNATTTGSLVGEGGSVTSTTTVEFVELFAGIVRATGVRATATSSLDGGRATSSGGAQFTTLTIAGLSYTNPRPNERVDLPGVGYVVLNEQIPGGDGQTSSSLVVNAIRLVITGASVFDAPAGTEFIVASAASGVPEIARTAPIVTGPPPTPTRVTYLGISTREPLDLSTGNDNFADENDNEFDFNENDNGNANDNGGATPTRASGTGGNIVVTVVVVISKPTPTPTPSPTTVKP